MAGHYTESLKSNQLNMDANNEISSDLGKFSELVLPSDRHCT